MLLLSCLRWRFTQGIMSNSNFDDFDFVMFWMKRDLRLQGLFCFGDEGLLCFKSLCVSISCNWCCCEEEGLKLMFKIIFSIFDGVGDCFWCCSLNDFRHLLTAFQWRRPFVVCFFQAFQSFCQSFVFFSSSLLIFFLDLMIKNLSENYVLFW